MILNRTEQNRTEQNRTEQNRTEQNRTEQNRTEQNRTEQLSLCSARSYPIFQNVLYECEYDALNCAVGDVHLVQDMVSGLVYNEKFDSSAIKYSPDYHNEQACSQTFMRHLDCVANIISRHFLKEERIAEIGCGKGTFLEILSSAGFDICGFDPSYDGDNPRIKRALFDNKSGIAANGIIMRHVLEHIHAPFSFLQMLSEFARGKIYIEVPCFDWICKNNAWFDIYYEHVNYLRPCDFENMFDKIYEIGHCFEGQYLYMVAELGSLKMPLLSDKISCLDLILPDFDIIKSPSCIWGAASKGVIFAINAMRNGAKIDLAVDLNPAKWEKFMPVSGVKVISLENALKNLPKDTTIYISNANYYDEVVTLSENKFRYEIIR